MMTRSARYALFTAFFVGQVSRDRRSWVFVSCVIGTDQTASLAAVDLAAQALHHEGVL
jgi:hypothetical protein